MVKKLQQLFLWNENCMAITIYICDKNGVLIDYENLPQRFYLQEIGVIHDIDVNDFYYLKNDKNISFLKYISQSDNVFFNQKQLEILLKDCGYVKMKNLLKHQVIDLVTTAIMIARANPNYYLKFKNS